MTPMPEICSCVQVGYYKFDRDIESYPDGLPERIPWELAQKIRFARGLHRSEKYTKTTVKAKY